MVKRPRFSLKNLDDVGEYIPVWGMSKEGILALPHPIRVHCHESFGVCENHNGLVVGEGVFKSRTCRCKSALPDEPAPPSTLQHPPPLVSCL